MINLAPQDNTHLDFIVVWKLNRFSMSLEETIELRDKLRELAPNWFQPQRKGSMINRGPGVWPSQDAGAALKC